MAMMKCLVLCQSPIALSLHQVLHLMLGTIRIGVWLQDIPNKGCRAQKLSFLPLMGPVLGGRHDYR